jgi:NADPH2:quinone reductase
MRKGVWAEAATLSGIECVGLVKSCPGGEFAVGTKVAAFTGGMGRTMNGSYAEYTYPPATNVVPIKTDLLWEEFAVISDHTQLPGRACIAIRKSKKAKPCLFGVQLRLWVGPALNISANAGAHIIATTRKKEGRSPTNLTPGGNASKWKK